MRLKGFHHTEETKRKISEKKKGIPNPNASKPGSSNGNWKGGRMESGGYILVLKHKHPYCDRDGYVLEHRLVLERKLGRYLLPGEVSHHLNGVRDDNRPENLAIYDNHSLHLEEHTVRRLRNEKGQFISATELE